MKTAYGKRMFSVLMLFFVLVLSSSVALAEFYVTPVGKPCKELPKGAEFYVIAVGNRSKQTVIVSPKGSEAESEAALRAALNKTTDESGTRYLIVIEPGTYDIGNTPLQIRIGDGSGSFEGAFHCFGDFIIRLAFCIMKQGEFLQSC